MVGWQKLKIKLSQDKWAEIDDEDYILIKAYKWYAVCRRSTWYTLADKIGGGGTVSMHRLISGLKTGDPRKVDHRDGDGLNNRRSNLRVCDNQRNRWNSKSVTDTTSKYKGVSWHKFRSGNGRWRASITVDGVKNRLGFFDTEEEAARAVDAFMIEHHGEYARLNFPIEEMA